jgi:hypothetical protein
LIERTRLPLADVGELDAVALRARELVADERLRLERSEQRVHRLDARIDAQRLSSPCVRFPRVEAEAVARAQQHRADGKRTPARAAKRHVDVARARQHKRACIPAFHAELTRNGQQKLDAIRTARRRELDRKRNEVALERAVAVELE